MGLAQRIQFQNTNPDQIKKFIIEFCQPYRLDQKDNLFIISSPGDNGYQVELAIENYGLHIHRSGNYFEILGMLIEEITGKFGKTTIEDY